MTTGIPAVSVLLPAYNAERFVLASVQSVLAQTFEDFELLVVDDCSTDGTPAILASIQDPRLRVLRNDANLGIVGSLNRAMAAARGRYIARADADDHCLPTRFAKQVGFLDSHPDVVLTGTRMFNLEGGRTRPNRMIADPDPAVLRWQFLVSNPVAHPSMMFRARVVAQLGTYLREEFKFAEDFDFSHRVLQLGDIAVMPERLVIYRLHQGSLTRTRSNEMVARAATVLDETYHSLLGREHAADARLVVEHLMAGLPVRSPKILQRLGTLLEHLLDAFLAAHPLDEAQRLRVFAHAEQAWWGAVQSALRAGVVAQGAFGQARFRFQEAGRPALAQLGKSALAGVVDRDYQVSRWLGTTGRPRLQERGTTPLIVQRTRYDPAPVDRDDPPRLYVVIDTEAEFDWTGPFDRALTAVDAMAGQASGQAIFDGYGLRPIYVIDYAVASRPEGYGPLRAILARHGCVVGAHLHPWITPPFLETVSDRNSFGGNLSAELEAQKLRALVEVIRTNLGISPLFFKAGRYGVGPRTMTTLAELEFAVDFSIMPKTDMSAQGGVDFSLADPDAYRAADGRILSVPMTRAHIGPLAALPHWVHGMLRSKPALRVKVPGLLARSGLLNTVTLTPEGVTAAEQIQLIQALSRRGQRTFVLHYHSPSLVPGNTPYVRTEADLAVFLERIRAVCGFFFDRFGGMPGNPLDLLPAGLRDRAWPHAG